MTTGQGPVSKRMAGSTVPADVEEFRVVAEHAVDPLLHAFGGVVRWIGPSMKNLDAGLVAGGVHGDHAHGVVPPGRPP